MNATPLNGSNGPCVTAGQFNRFNSWTDAELLNLAVTTEQSTRDFDLSIDDRHYAETDGGLHFFHGSVLPPLPADPPLHLLRIINFFTDLAEESWDVTCKNCLAAPINRTLRQPVTALFLALIAWRREAAKRRSVVAGSIDHQLQSLSPEERERALESFAYDAAVSCAYEGIDIAPRQLAASIGA